MSKAIAFWALIALSAIPLTLGPLATMVSAGSSAPLALMASLAASALLITLAAATSRPQLVALAVALPLLVHAVLTARPPSTDWDLYAVFTYGDREFPVPRRAGFQTWVRSVPGRPTSVRIVVEPPSGWEGEVEVTWELASGDEVLWRGEESILPAGPVTVVAEVGPEALEDPGRGGEAIVLDLRGRGHLPNGTTLFVADYRRVANVFYDRDGRIRLIQLKLPRGTIEPRAAKPPAPGGPAVLEGPLVILADLAGATIAAGAALYWVVGARVQSEGGSL